MKLPGNSLRLSRIAIFVLRLASKLRWTPYKLPQTPDAQDPRTNIGLTVPVQALNDYCCCDEYAWLMDTDLLVKVTDVCGTGHLLPWCTAPLLPGQTWVVGVIAMINILTTTATFFSDSVQPLWLRQLVMVTGAIALPRRMVLTLDAKQPVAQQLYHLLGI